jgi:1-acyl-sn-glycerol-3-phosphate acyltransferase
MGAEWDRCSRVRKVSQAVLSAVFRACWGLTIEGTENLPEEGGVIVAAAPHLSIFDVVIAVATGPRRVMLAMTKAEAYDVPGLGWWLRKTGTIKLERKGAGDVGALRLTIDALKEGKCVGLFPEGTRSKTGVPGRAKQGTGFLAARSGAAVVPLRVIGMKDFPFTRLTVRIGAPMRLDDPEADREACLAFSQSVLDRALSL